MLATVCLEGLQLYVFTLLMNEIFEVFETRLKESWHGVECFIETKLLGQ